MQSRWFLNAVLLAIIAVLSTLVFLEPGTEKKTSAPLLSLSKETLNSVTLQNQVALQFEKKEGHWYLVSPFPAPANDVRIGQLLEIVDTVPEAQYPIKPEDNLGQFGLEPPNVITLTLNGMTVYFGGTDPIQMHRYVKIGNTLYLVNDHFSHHLTASPADYVDKKLLPENAKVNEIVLPGLKAKLDRNGQWVQESGNDKLNMNELAHLWSTVRAIEVRYKKDNALTGDAVHIGLGEGHKSVVFFIVQKEPDVVLARPDLGLYYELTGETAQKLLNLHNVTPKTAMQNGKQESESEGYEPSGEFTGEDDGENIQH